MKTYKNALCRIFLLAIAFSSSVSNAISDPCESCNTAVTFQAHMLTERYRYEIAQLTPFVGSESGSFVGGSWDNGFSQFLNTMGAITALWDSMSKVPSTYGSATAYAVFVNSLFSASAIYWEQINMAQIQFDYDLAVLDRDYCNCILSRGCATSCDFFYH